MDNIKLANMLKALAEVELQEYEMANHIGKYKTLKFLQIKQKAAGRPAAFHRFHAQKNRSIFRLTGLVACRSKKDI